MSHWDAANLRPSSIAANKQSVDEAAKLLRECKKVMQAEAFARNMHKDLLQRVADFLRRNEKENKNGK